MVFDCDPVEFEMTFGWMEAAVVASAALVVVAAVVVRFLTESPLPIPTVPLGWNTVIAWYKVIEQVSKHSCSQTSEHPPIAIPRPTFLRVQQKTIVEERERASNAN